MIGDWSREQHKRKPATIQVLLLTLPIICISASRVGGGGIGVDSIGTTLAPAQAKHAPHTVKTGNPVHTAPGNQFPGPVLIDSKKQDIVCVPAQVTGVAAVP